MSSNKRNCLTSIVLTFNSEQSLPTVLAPLLRLSNRVLVVDSFSTDRTLELAADAGCEVVQHPFDNYSRQRNWAQGYAALADEDWVLHVDADEVIGQELEASIAGALLHPSGSGYLVRRLPYFLGRPIRHGHMHPNWHLRLFKAGVGLCEDRLYDQHFVLTSGTATPLEGWLHDLQCVSIERWTDTHNRWSTAEALEVKSRTRTAACPAFPANGQLDASFLGDSRERKRWYKSNLYYRTPPLLRAFVFFLYSYVFKRGFLDGKIGLIYHVLQAFWFRFLVDAKLTESSSGNSILRDYP